MNHNIFTKSIKNMTPEDIATLRQFSSSLSEAYETASKKFPPAEFESLMADLCEDIISLQMATENQTITFMTAGLIMLAGNQEDPNCPSHDPDFQIFIKAAIAWYCLNKENVEGLLNTKL